MMEIGNNPLREIPDGGEGKNNKQDCESRKQYEILSAKHCQSEQLKLKINHEKHGPHENIFSSG